MFVIVVSVFCYAVAMVFLVIARVLLWGSGWFQGFAMWLLWCYDYKQITHFIKVDGLS